MDVLIELILILGLARMSGSLVERLGQPRVVGELLTGFVLGKAWLDIIQPDAALDILSNLGIIFLMYLAGLHMKPQELLDVSIPAFLIAIFGAFVPMVLGYEVTIWYGFDPVHALFVGVGLSITAVAVKARILMDLGGLESRVGKVIMGAAVLDDVIGLVFFAILSSLAVDGVLPTGGALLSILVHVMFFFGFAVLAGYLLPYLSPKIREIAETKDALFTFCLVVSFSFAYAAEEFGLHPMIGAYIAGLLVKSLGMRGIDTKQVLDMFTPVAFGFLGPLFFVRIALDVDASAIFQNASFVLAIIAVAIIGKVIGCGVAALLTGSSRREAVVIGLGMNGRGAVELVIAQFGRQLATNPLPDVIFSALVIMAFTTTLLTPITLKWALPWYNEERFAHTEPTWHES